jgi:hypothetical protein
MAWMCENYVTNAGVDGIVVSVLPLAMEALWLKR